MNNEPNIEKNTSPELSVAEVLSRTSAKVDEMIAYAEASEEADPPYSRVHKSISETGVETALIISRATGSKLNRTYDPETNATSYEMRMRLLGQARDFIGEGIYSWSSLEPVIYSSVDTIERGRTEPVQCTDLGMAESIGYGLESHFPKQLPPMEPVLRHSHSEEEIRKSLRMFKPGVGKKILKMVGVAKPYNEQQKKYENILRNSGLK